MKRKMCILVLLLLLLSPVCGQINLPSKFASLHYQRYTGSNKTTWKNAQAFCRKYHTDLVTIRNEDQNQDVYSVSGWIGLYRENVTSPWKWSRGDEIAKFFSWAPGENQPHEHCAFKKHNESSWRNIDCGNTRPFICFDEKLVLVKENKTWEEALNHCRSLGGVDPNDPTSTYQNHRFDLPTLITPADHDDARERAQQATTDEVWTGLRYLAGYWWWVGGEAVQYQDIQSCPTVGSCGVLEKSSRTSFRIRDCAERRNFFCYERP